jgi:putative ABC transport system substrate-binding protein
LLKEALPSASQVVALWYPGAYGERTMNDMMKDAEATGLTLGLHIRFVAVQAPDELDRAFSTIAAEHTDAIMVFPSPMLFVERGRIVDLAGKLRVPLICMNKEFVKLGGLLSYGADVNDFFRRGASYVDRILRGASPADLPVERPTKYELVINLKTAKALGIDIPATLLVRADEVIE